MHLYGNCWDSWYDQSKWFLVCAKANAETMCVSPGWRAEVQMSIWLSYHLYAPQGVDLGGGGYSSSKNGINTERLCTSEYDKALLIQCNICGEALDGRMDITGQSTPGSTNTSINTASITRSIYYQFSVFSIIIMTGLKNIRRLMNMTILWPLG